MVKFSNRHLLFFFFTNMRFSLMNEIGQYFFSSLYRSDIIISAWNMKVTIIPIVIGAFGTVSKGLLKGMEDLEVGDRVETIQTTALLKTARILTRVQETWGDLLSLNLQWNTISLRWCEKLWVNNNNSWIISKVKLATIVEGDPNAPFSIATTPRCRGGRYSIPWIAPLYPWTVPYNAEC